MDGHQQRFSRRLGGQGLVLLCEQREALEAALDGARHDPARLLFGHEQRGALVEASVQRIGGIIDELVAQRSRRRGLVARLLRRPPA